jgi:hypothetical protein
MSKYCKKPDLNAPRFRYSGLRVITEEFVDNFRKKNPAYKDITLGEFKSIVKKFNETLWREVIENRDGIQLPEGLGYLFIGTCQPSTKRTNYDFTNSTKYNKAIQNRNWETDGKVAKIFYWSWAEKYHYKNREVWGFTACRNFKRAVSKEYPLNWTMYHIVDPKKKIREQFKKQRGRDYALEKEKEELKNYNDFEL